MMETYHGVVRTPTDAIKLFEACRIGLLPRVQRRLSEKERQAITSGSVFVWDEREAGMRRWTDGKSWSASRVSGSFLTYREMEGKRGNGFTGNRRGAGKTPDSNRGSDEDRDDIEPDGYRYKADGLMKQSFSITTSAGQHLHLISYFSRNQTDLMQPSTDPNLRHLVPAKGLYPESSLNEAPVPALTRAPMQQSYGPPPQHPPPHHPAYGYQHHQQPPSQWPPSPVATPPYNHAGHYGAAPPYTQGPPPPHHYGPQHQQPYQQPHPHPPPHPHQHPHQHPHHYGPPPPHVQPYERAPLPPPHHSAPPAPLPPRNPMPLPQPYQTASPHPHGAQPPPRLAPIDSPRSQHLQAAAREAVQIDPRLGTNAIRSPPGGSQGHSGPPLPALITPQPSGSAHTPPTRALSPSPPRSSHSDSKGPAQTNASRQPHLSALLLHPHPSPSSSEPNSANPGSAGSANNSPKGANGAPSSAHPGSAGGESRPHEDSRALDKLNRKFAL